MRRLTPNEAFQVYQATLYSYYNGEYPDDIPNWMSDYLASGDGGLLDALYQLATDGGMRTCDICGHYESVHDYSSRICEQRKWKRGWIRSKSHKCFCNGFTKAQEESLND